MRTKQKSQLESAVSRWLAAETGAVEADADRALGRLFRLMPLPAPGRAFVAQTLRRAGLARRPVRDFSARWVRTVLAASLVLTAAAVMMGQGVLVALYRGGLAGKPVELAVELLAGVLQRVAQGLAVWDVLGSLTAGLLEVTSSPALLGATGAALFLSFVAFRRLDRIVAAERRASHV